MFFFSAAAAVVAALNAKLAKRAIAESWVKMDLHIDAAKLHKLECLRKWRKSIFIDAFSSHRRRRLQVALELWLVEC